MKATDILTLVQAGYTRAEIEAMEQDLPAEVPADSPAAVPAPAPAPVTVESSAPAPADNPELLAAIRDLTAAVQKKNVINSSQPADVSKEGALDQADKLFTQFLNT